MDRGETTPEDVVIDDVAAADGDLAPEEFAAADGDLADGVGPDEAGYGDWAEGTAEAAIDDAAYATTAMEVSNLKVSFSGREVIHGIDLAFERGRVSAILGPSGCGKTTLMRCLNRLTELTPGSSVSGVITLD